MNMPPRAEATATTAEDPNAHDRRHATHSRDDRGTRGLHVHLPAVVEVTQVVVGCPEFVVRRMASTSNPLKPVSYAWFPPVRVQESVFPAFDLNSSA